MEFTKECTGVNVNIDLTKEEAMALMTVEKLFDKIVDELDDILRGKVDSISVAERKVPSDDYKTYHSFIEAIISKSREIQDLMEDNSEFDGFYFDTYALMK